MQEGAEDGAGHKELAWDEVWALKCFVQFSGNNSEVLRWGKNLQAPISRVLTEADRGHGSAPGKLLVLKGQSMGGGPGQLQAPPGTHPEHSSGAENTKQAHHVTRGLSAHTRPGGSHLQLVWEPAAGAQGGAAPTCWLGGGGHCAAALTCLGHAGQAPRSALLSLNPPRATCYVTPNDDRETEAEGRALSWGRQGLELGTLCAHYHTALPLSGSLCVWGGVGWGGGV